MRLRVPAGNDHALDDGLTIEGDVQAVGIVEDRDLNLRLVHRRVDNDGFDRLAGVHEVEKLLVDLLHHRPPILRAGRPQRKAEAAAEAERAEGEQLVRVVVTIDPSGNSPSSWDLRRRSARSELTMFELSGRSPTGSGQTAEGALALKAHPQGDGDPRRRPGPPGSPTTGLASASASGSGKRRTAAPWSSVRFIGPRPLREVEVLGRPRAEAPRLPTSSSTAGALARPLRRVLRRRDDERESPGDLPRSLRARCPR